MKKRKPRTLLAFDSPWDYDPGTIRTFAPGDGASREETSRRVGAGEHKTPFMLETSSERQLLFTRMSLQSTMLIDEPDTLICAYTQKMMSFLLFNPDPRHIVMIGVGGGSLAKFCYRHLRNTRFTGVEIDADVIALRDEFLLPADNERFRIVHEDGVRFMRRLDEPVDVILVDAFDADGVARSLATSKFYDDAIARLDDDGILVMNLSGDRSRYATHLNRLRQVFDDRLLILPVSSSDNVLVFAFKAELPEPADIAFAQSAQHLQSQLQLEFPRYLQRLCQRHELSFEDY